MALREGGSHLGRCCYRDWERPRPGRQAVRVTEASTGENTRRDGHAFVDGVVDELIQSRADTRTSNEDLTHRINGVRERLSERIGQVEREVREMRTEQRVFASQVVELLTDIQRRLPGS